MNAPYQPRDNTGSLFKNDRKESDTHPDYKGSALLNGVEHWVDAWINEKRDGSGKYLSFKVKAKDQQSAPTGRAPAPATDRGFNDLDDDVPF